MNQPVKTLWETEGQSMELDFHKSGRGDWRWNTRWDDARYILNNQFGFDFEEFCYGNLLDIGCGPRSMLDWWSGNNKYGIDPLSNEYKKLNGKRRNSFDILDVVYDQPAEVLVDELVGQIDFVWSHNALDHCYCWETVMDNIDKYLKPDGSVYIGTDAGKPPNPNHPGIPSVADFLNKVESLGWSVMMQYERSPDDPVWLRTVGIIANK